MSKERFKNYYNESVKRYEVFDCYVNLPLSKKGIIETLNDQQDKIADLEAKLAEKEKEIEQLKKFDDLNKTFFDLFRTAFKEPNKVDDLFNTLKTMQEQQDQDKISFAVEQLEKVKDIILTIQKNKDGFISTMIDLYDFNETIDNQIKQLKEEM